MDDLLRRGRQARERAVDGSNAASASKRSREVQPLEVGELQEIKQCGRGTWGRCSRTGAAEQGQRSRHATLLLHVARLRVCRVAFDERRGGQRAITVRSRALVDRGE